MAESLQSDQSDTQPATGKYGSNRLLVLLILAISFFFIGSKVGKFVLRLRQAEKQLQAVEKLRQLGGVVYYDYQYKKEGSAETLLDTENRPNPTWMYDYLGQDFLHDVFYVTFALFRTQSDESKIPIQIQTVTDDKLAPLHDLVGLRWLALNGTQVTDAGVEQLESLPELERLWLSNTRLSDKGMKSLRGLTHLEQLYINDTLVTDKGLKYLRGLKNLRQLWLTGSQTTDTGMAQLRGLEQLELLYVDNGLLTDKGMKDLAKLVNLQSLRMSFCNRVGDRGFKYFENLEHLKQLYLIQCQNLTDEGLAHFAKLKNLEVLALNGTRVSNTGLSSLKGMAHLKTLHLYHTGATLSGVVHLFTELQKRSLDDAFEAVAQVERNGSGQITSLDLSHIRVTNAGLSYLKDLSKIEWLYLNGTEVDDKGLAQLEQLKSLTLLQLAGTKVTDAGMENLAKLTHLRTVNLADTTVTDEGVKKLQEAFHGNLRVQRIQLQR